MLRRTLLGWGLVLATAGATAAGTPAREPETFRFASLDGGQIDLADYAGNPVLVVNTASRCGFTSQYAGLQALQDRYGPRGLTVVGVPSDSFRQELSSAEAVRDFCEVNFSIDFPMTEITPVTGRGAHPFYRWARAQGVAPMWNFTKILLDGQGRIAGSWGPAVGPEGPQIRAAIEAALPSAAN